MNIDEILNDFIEVCKISGIPLTRKDITIESLSKGQKHQPTPLPKGQVAVYVFLFQDQCLKVGKVGPRSNARYQNQHYSPKSSNSNLAKSIINDPTFNFYNRELEIGIWIKKNTTRLDFLMSAEIGMLARNLLEIFLQCRLRPRYEGYNSQNN